MIIVEGAPYSLEIWDWFAANKGLARRDREVNVAAFSGLLLLEGERSFGDLTPPRFVVCLDGVFDVAVGLSSSRVDPGISIETIDAEVDALKRTALWWALTEGAEGESFEAVNPQTLVAAGKRFSHAFRYRVYYTLVGIRSALNALRRQLSTRFRHPEVSLMKRLGPHNVPLCEEPRDAFIKNIIKSTNAGDLDEFILYCIARIQFLTMTPMHEKLAQLVRFELFGVADFDHKMPESETWRMLKSRYFDEVEDVFEDFFARHKADCLMFFLNDYLSTDMGIERIPFYGVYTNDAGASFALDVALLIDMPRIKREVARVHKEYNLT